MPYNHVFTCNSSTVLHKKAMKDEIMELKQLIIDKRQFVGTLSLSKQIADTR